MKLKDTVGGANMKLYLILTAIICLTLALLPLGFINNSHRQNSNIETTQTESLSDSTVTVFLSTKNETADIEITDYLIGAVAAEMPASYNIEALKAQAVASYSYLMWVRKNADNPDYDITSDPATHQGYLTEDEMKAKWGDKYETYRNKILEAVSAVYGEYMTYKGEPILALFHAISPGTTQNSKDVWESELPYIKPKSAPGDTLSPDYDSEVSVPCQKIRDLFSVKSQVSDSELIDISLLSDTSFVKEICLGEKTVSAGDLASKLGLRSPYFTAEYKQGSYIFKVKGYGHGLGMSQYSADYMARQGSTYSEILAHFYEGIKIEKAQKL